MSMTAESITVATAMVLCLGLFAPPTASGDEKSARDLLRDRGLSKYQSTYTLPGEGELRSGVRMIRSLENQLRSAQKDLEIAQQEEDEADKEIERLYERRSQLNAMLPDARSSRRWNRLAAEINQVTDRINLLQSRAGSSQTVEKAESAVGGARKAFLDHIAALRKGIVETRRAYAQLAEDPEVTAALAELSEIDNKELKLGPGDTFDANVRRLEKYDDVATSDSVPLRREGDLFWVQTEINGQHSLPFVFDTGASLVVVPAPMAQTIGLHPSADARKIMLTIADGSSIQATLTRLDSVKIGRFEARDVDCAVMPPEMTNAPPLLGGSFLKHFTYSIDPQTRTLSLSGAKLDD